MLKRNTAVAQRGKNIAHHGNVDQRSWMQIGKVLVQSFDVLFHGSIVLSISPDQPTPTAPNLHAAVRIGKGLAQPEVSNLHPSR